MELVYVIVAVNVLCMVLMYIIEWLESRAGDVPKRSKNFRYLRDWNTTRIGDWVGLSILDAVLIPQLLSGELPVSYALAALLFGFLLTAASFSYFLSSKHRPDSGVPGTGRLSWQGTYHAVYFYLQMSIGIYGLILFNQRLLSGEALTLGALGGAIYLTTALADGKKFLPRS